MLLYLALGIVAVLLVHLALRRYATMPPKQAKHLLQWLGGGLLAASAVLVPWLRKWLLLGLFILPWRRYAQGGADAQGQRPSSGRMTLKEARDVLGVDETATREDIEKAYRARMQQYHPDKGGSDYFAAKLNEAREVLLLLSKDH